MFFLGYSQPHGRNIKNKSVFWWKRKPDESHLKEVWWATHFGRSCVGSFQTTQGNQATSILSQGMGSTVQWKGSTMRKRPQFNCNGTVTVNQLESPSASKASQLHAQALGMDWRGWADVARWPAAAGSRPAPPGRLPCIRGPASREGTALVVPAAPALPGPIAAVVKDSFLEEWWELTNGVFWKSQPHFVDV